MVLVQAATKRAAQLLLVVALKVSLISLYFHHSFLEREMERSEATASQLQTLQSPQSIPRGGTLRGTTTTTAAAGDAAVAVDARRASTTTDALSNNNNNQQPRKTRVLVGIFTQDVNPDRRYRKKFRELFEIDPRVCSLAQFMNGTSVDPNIPCELIYTFVAGSAKSGPTENVDDSERPLLDPRQHVRSITPDFNYDDITHLNIVYVLISRERKDDVRSMKEVIETHACLLFCSISSLFPYPQ